ncbi:MAG TPA: hypothetical protein VGL53_00445 [Bryobacteraceae bacterium]|jgi:hypothetical protein
MKHLHVSSKLGAAAVLGLAALTLPCFAGTGESPIKTHWENVCAISDGKQLIVTTETGEVVEGYCISVDVNKIAIRTLDHRFVQVSRSALMKLEMQRPKAHQLASLGRGVKKGLHRGVQDLFSPMAIGGMVLIPATLAWGAVSTPFCILGDLFATEERRREIKVTALDPPVSNHVAYSH